MTFWAYMLHCRGGVFYTGHSDDLERRVAEHTSGLIGGFTRNRAPIELVWSQEFPTRYEALTAERQIKGWSRAKKLALIRGDWSAVSRLAKAKSGPSTSSGRTGLEVRTSVLAAIVDGARRTHPAEACGLLLGSAGHVARASFTGNVAADPARHFEIDPAALITAHKAERAGGDMLIGYWHSHPSGPATPSATDRTQAAGDGKVWAIVGAGGIGWWRDTAGGFVALSTAVVDG